MTQSNGGFSEYLEREVKKYRGIYVPVRSSALRRMLVRWLPCKKIHPNPDDEFCNPEIGPNADIISNYRVQFRKMDQGGGEMFVPMEPLTVERIRPDGYMLLNGHHRWAAAIMTGQSSVPVSITNLTQKSDIEQMLKNSKHQKRAALDLDEVVFAGDGALPAEKALPFPFRLMYPQRLRLGIPRLFRYLNVNGYDIWVYSRSYHSLDYVKALFGLYHVYVTGIVTGTDRKRAKRLGGRESIEKMISSHFDMTLSIDRDALLLVNHQTKAYKTLALSGGPDEWSMEIMEKMGSFEKDE